ncbi:MAG: hypothetical protein WDO15_22155 [Bacteroidota bacterium]
MKKRGSRDLYIGWPFVHGKFLDGTLVRCPLLYFPAELKLEEGQWSLHLRSDVDVTFNKSFLLAYSFYNKVQPNEALLEEDFADFDKDSTVFRTTVYQMLQKNNLEVNFNPDNFRDELIAFKEYKKDEFEGTYGNGQLKLIPEAVLGVFPTGRLNTRSRLSRSHRKRKDQRPRRFFLSKNTPGKRRRRTFPAGRS